MIFTEVICNGCGKKFHWKIKKLPTKIEDKRWEEICCPHCQKANGKELLLGNEEIEIIVK